MSECIKIRVLYIAKLTSFFFIFKGISDDKGEETEANSNKQIKYACMVRTYVHSTTI